MKLIKVLDQVEGYTIEEIKEYLPFNEYDDFCKWFEGKTGAITEDGKYLVYSWDLRKYLRSRKEYQNESKTLQETS